MRVEFKKVNDKYEGNTKYFNYETEKHEAIYTIEKIEGNWILKNAMENIELGTFKKLAKAKGFLPYELAPTGEIEQGFADGGGWSGGVCITGDGKGFAWHKDENGNRVDE